VGEKGEGKKRDLKNGQERLEKTLSASTQIDLCLQMRFTREKD